MWNSIAACLLMLPPPATVAAYQLVEVVAVDGDTVNARILLPWKVSLGPESIRASNYDAYESRRNRKTVGPITDGEIASGKAAAKALEELLTNSRVFVVPDGNGKRDAYGRILGELWLKRDNEWVDVSAWMKEHGHVRGTSNATDKLENFTGARIRVLDGTLHNVGPRRLKRIRLP